MEGGTPRQENFPVQVVVINYHKAIFAKKQWNLLHDLGNEASKTFQEWGLKDGVR